METLAQDLPYALRTFRRRPGLTAALVVTLALGIGANTAIFSVVNAVLLQRLPFPSADRLVMVWEDATNAGFPRNTPAVGNVIRESKTFMLPGIIQTGRKLGMKLMDDSLTELFEAGVITAEEAVYRADQKNQMLQITGHR